MYISVNFYGPQFSAENFAKFRGPAREIPRRGNIIQIPQLVTASVL